MTELDPKLNRAWEYANGFLYNNFKTEEEVTRFINQPDIKKKFRDEEREFMLVAWLMITGNEVVELEEEDFQAALTDEVDFEVEPHTLDEEE